MDSVVLGNVSIPLQCLRMDFGVLLISSSFPFDFAIACEKLRTRPQQLMNDQEQKKSVKMRKDREGRKNE
jgi:hypothetical protein